MGQQEFITSEGLRRDGRRAKELRRIKCQLGVLQDADGSAMFEMGNTQVLASVFGPREVENRSEMQQDKAIVKCEYAMAAFSTGERRRRGKTDRRSTELSKVIRNTLEQTICLELLPRSQIDVCVQVLQADGGTRCACINAANLALADAGIPMHDMVASCAVGFLQSTPVLDLNYMEDAGGGPDISVATHPNMDRLVLLQMDGKLPPEMFEECVALAVDGCKAVASVMRGELIRHTKCMAVATGLLSQQQ
eukprot:GHRR01003792.1.p1 GENE.GHRR01003792.1~~GHRR01003792.1.p1  ORF type:complete len:250 (+),score=66.73 GHRR01003792.1:129-878(+)